MKPILIIIQFSIVLILSNCGKKTSDSFKINESNYVENSLPKKLKSIKIDQAEEFVILAYASITSTRGSSINGKVGLLPGIKDQIMIDPIEVAGGAADIIGSEDETIPLNLLSNAKVDMVTLYKVADALSPDNDKTGLDGTKINGKILSPGCYKWNGDLFINSDFTIDGSDTDVWIFKIPANFKIATGVHLTLRGGAKASNIFWQVAGGATLESDTVFAGTIIAQQFVELKSHAKLTGRAFAKNGYVNLDQSVISKPQ